MLAERRLQRKRRQREDHPGVPDSRHRDERLHPRRPRLLAARWSSPTSRRSGLRDPLSPVLRFYPDESSATFIRSLRAAFRRGLQARAVYRARVRVCPWAQVLHVRAAPHGERSLFIDPDCTSSSRNSPISSGATSASQGRLGFDQSPSSICGDHQLATRSFSRGFSLSSSFRKATLKTDSPRQVTSRSSILSSSRYARRAVDMSGCPRTSSTRSVRVHPRQRARDPAAGHDRHGA